MQAANTTTLRCGLLTVSATQDTDSDRSGAIARNTLAAAGHEVSRQRCLADDLSNVRHLIREWIDSAELDVIVAIGSTGVLPTDVTPEALAPLVTKAMPGFGELFRMLAFHEFGVRALESRACAAVCERTLVYLLPGAPEAVSLAMNRLVVPQLSTISLGQRERVSVVPPTPAIAVHTESQALPTQHYAASGGR
jgi:molybdenum cofactor biosynthesis protein B